MAEYKRIEDCFESADAFNAFLTAFYKRDFDSLYALLTRVKPEDRANAHATVITLEEGVALDLAVDGNLKPLEDAFVRTINRIAAQVQHQVPNFYTLPWADLHHLGVLYDLVLKTPPDTEQMKVLTGMAQQAKVGLYYVGELTKRKMASK